MINKIVEKVKESKVKKKVKEFEDVVFECEWQQVLENRKGHRPLKEKGKQPTEEDLDYILKKLSGEKD